MGAAGGKWPRTVDCGTPCKILMSSSGCPLVEMTQKFSTVCCKSCDSRPRSRDKVTGARQNSRDQYGGAYSSHQLTVLCIDYSLVPVLHKILVTFINCETHDDIYDEMIIE
ncbi:jg25252 [Pararge aegeria aegeria]|uniref:Jg25252 protein n=1 Tax=Pararge aegeria aegeria TaxID=348720 RepID=A0A8S4SDY2_9NEOP|nr:jg25252 [Pararge aegeria aegeria]